MGKYYPVYFKFLEREEPREQLSVSEEPREQLSVCEEPGDLCSDVGRHFETDKTKVRTRDVPELKYIIWVSTNNAMETDIRSTRSCSL